MKMREEGGATAFPVGRLFRCAMMVSAACILSARLCHTFRRVAALPFRAARSRENFGTFGSKNVCFQCKKARNLVAGVSFRRGKKMSNQFCGEGWVVFGHLYSAGALRDDKIPPTVPGQGIFALTISGGAGGWAAFKKLK